MTLKQGAQRVEIDARPSDAIALAIHTHSPMFATDAVMEKAAILVPQPIEIPSPPRGIEKLMQSWQAEKERVKLRAPRAEEEWRQAQRELVELVFGA